jgi:hypothetical protein
VAPLLLIPKPNPSNTNAAIVFQAGNNPAFLQKKRKNRSFFEKCEKIFEEQQKLSRDRPKYFERTFANFSIFYTFLLEIENPEYSKKLLPKFFTLADEQTAEYAKEGIDENVDRDKIFLNYPDKFALIVYLAEINYMAAKVMALNYEEKEKLEAAIRKLKTSQKLHGPTIDEWQEKIAKAIVGILQRLGNPEKTFEYIHSLAEDQSVETFKSYHEKSSGFAPDKDQLVAFIKHKEEYKDEISILFEDIIFSEAYQAWEAENVPETDQEEEETIAAMVEESPNEPETAAKTNEAPKAEKRSFWQKMFGSN